MIVWNTFQMSMDIRVKLSDWDRPLGVWTIHTPRKLIYSNVYKYRFRGMGN